MSTDPLFMKQAGQYYWYQNDHLGTPQVMTTSSGAVVWSAKYTSFGKASVDPSSTVVNPLRFPGQYEDIETGLLYNWHRYFDSKLGAYLRADPIGLEGGINLYAYVFNNPIRFTDPRGLSILDGVILPILRYMGSKTDDCKLSEWQYCEGECPYGVNGCYVTVRWRIKGVRGGNIIRVEERTVNCNCQEPPCDEKWWEPLTPILPVIPLLTPWPDPY